MFCLVLFMLICGMAKAGNVDSCRLPPRQPIMSTHAPERWNGISYYTAGHQFYNMLNDWFSVDSVTGLPVYEMADRDMAMLASEGFNFLHLYLWDKNWFGVGFNPLEQNPCDSENSQWPALDDFLSRAEKYGLYVGLHFASFPVVERLQSNITVAEAKRLGDDYFAWTRFFVENLSPRHGNIVLWGFVYGFGPAADAGGEQNPWNAFYKTAYRQLYDLIKSKTRPGLGLGRMAVNLVAAVKPAGDGYNYNWNADQVRKQAGVITELGLPAPDIYMLQLYNANSANLAGFLSQLLPQSVFGQDPGAIKPEKILVVEFGNSSSLADPPYGNNLAGVGDAFAPSLTLAGHRQWLINSLCAFRTAGVNKMAYWELYDAWDFWQKPPFSLSGLTLAWNGYWGLFGYNPYLNQPLAPKPGFEALTAYYKNEDITCSMPPVPVISLKAEPDSVVLGESFDLIWTATDVQYMAIDNGVGQVFNSLGSIKIRAETTGLLKYTLTATARNTGLGQSIERQATADVEVRVNRTRPPRSRKRNYLR